MRFLFVVPPFAGHVNPTVAVAADLTARGHDVAWAGVPDVLRRLLPQGAAVYPAQPTGDLARLHEVWGRARGVAALKFLWQEALIPLARAMEPGVDQAVSAFAPDVVVADQQALAGPVVARRRGVPWATSASTSAEFTRPYECFPRVEAWVREQVALLSDDPDWDPRFSDRLVLIFSSPLLAGGTTRPSHHLYVGPALGNRPDGNGFPWHRLDPRRRRVLVSLGTLNQAAGERFFPAVVEATRPLAERLQVILAAPEHSLPTVPEHVLLQQHVPQLSLLPHLDAVVCHGGHNTVCEALAHGLPLVVAPIRDDQPIIARQVVEAGAGVRVRFGRARAAEVRTAICDVLDDPRYRTAAAAVRESFQAAGGSAAAATALEDLAAAGADHG